MFSPLYGYFNYVNRAGLARAWGSRGDKYRLSMHLDGKGPGERIHSPGETRSLHLSMSHV